MPQSAEKFLPGRLSRVGFIILAITSVLCATLGEPLAAASAAAAAFISLTINARTSNPQPLPWRHLRMACFIVLALALLGALWTGPWALSHWLYALPLVTFALLASPLAALITALLTFAILISTQWAVSLPDRHQMISAFVLTTLLSALLIFLREYKTRQLAPLRRTDELTQAASREYLSADLHKEIQRSEREGTDMSVMMIGLDTHLSDNDPDEDIRAILPRIGRYLHSQLRDFDTYYRVADLQFLVILPGINTAGTATRAEKIRIGLCKLLASHGMKLTVSTGISGLNIGDDADSLQQSAANALTRAQQQGGNRTQAYSNWVHSDVHNLTARQDKAL
ncbi:MAG: diguanylate cyclase (GGDEF) domain [Marinobacter excellens HL-55]|uniref:diguanylate cyclase n=1 Tax=Marinobacter excellens HL-55 TaxID=1305731 RepID=A0A0P7YED9_9GAMM|nr:MAG: diguanylate cyclase (GGDEF) domain [Marinobacter excellens HL-55]